MDDFEEPGVPLGRGEVGDRPRVRPARRLREQVQQLPTRAFLPCSNESNEISPADGSRRRRWASGSQTFSPQYSTSSSRGHHWGHWECGMGHAIPYDDVDKALLGLGQGRVPAPGLEGVEEDGRGQGRAPARGRQAEQTRGRASPPLCQVSQGLLGFLACCDTWAGLELSFTIAWHVAGVK